VLNWLLIVVPVAIALEYLAPERHLLVFVAAALAILPLAGWMGRATEQLAERSGRRRRRAAQCHVRQSGGADHRAGRAARRAVRRGESLDRRLHRRQHPLVLGAAMLAGGLRHPEQHFNASGARSQATLLTLAAIALILPAAYNATAGGHPPGGLGFLSVSISVVLLAVYVLFLVFSLVTHKDLFSGSLAAEHDANQLASWSTARAITVLAGATALVAWISEILVGAIEPTAHEFGVSKVFMGVFIVAILGNAAEHATAVTAALKNRMDLSLSIAIRSSVQVALFVAPVLVLASLVIGRRGWISPSPGDWC
jgi:Ca2+:H+ antiporter